MSSRERTTRTDESAAALVQACLRGEEAAWHELVERYGRLVYSIPRRLGLSDADADDVFQGVFLLLYRNLATLRDQSRVSSWLITAAYRESWRIGRQSGRLAELDERLADDGPPPEAEVVRLEREQQVRQAMGRLDERCRELLTALFLETGQPRYDAIAARLGMPTGSIGPTRARCFRKLEPILRELGFEGPV